MATDLRRAVLTDWQRGTLYPPVGVANTVTGSGLVRAAMIRRELREMPKWQRRLVVWQRPVDKWTAGQWAIVAMAAWAFGAAVVSVVR